MANLRILRTNKITNFKMNFRTFFLVVVFGLFTVSVQAQTTIIDQGDCGANGNNLTWILTYDGVDSILTISGSGAMEDYDYNAYAPWYNYRTQMTTLIIGDSITTIGNYAFSGCTAFTGTLIIPNSVITIGASAFSGCNGFTGTLTIPNSVTTIGVSAFINCDNLTSVNIGNNVTTIVNTAFMHCLSLTSINVNNENNTYSSENGVLFNKDKTTIILCPAGKIGNYLIPNSVTNVLYQAFFHCASLTSINVESENNYFTSEDGVLFDKNMDTLICCPAGRIGGYIIPNNVKVIGNYSFGWCIELISITIPNGVIGIEPRAFSRCDALTSITIPSSVTYIGEIAFPRTAANFINITNLNPIPGQTHLKFNP